MELPNTFVGMNYLLIINKFTKRVLLMLEKKI